MEKILETPVDQLITALPVFHRNHGGGIVQNRLEPFLAALAGKLDLFVLRRQRHVRSDGLCNGELFRRTLVRPGVVEHEFAEDTGVERQWNEGKRADLLALKYRLERGEGFVAPDVRHHDRPNVPRPS